MNVGVVERRGEEVRPPSVVPAAKAKPMEAGQVRPGRVHLPPSTTVLLMST